MATAKAKGIKLGRKFATEKTESRPNPVNVKEVIRLRDEGISGNEIGKRLGVHGATISRMLRRLNATA